MDSPDSNNNNNNNNNNNDNDNSNSSNADNQINETTSLLPGGSPQPKWRLWPWSARQLGALVVAAAAFATAAVVLLGLLGLWMPDRFGGYEVWAFSPSF